MDQEKAVEITYPFDSIIKPGSVQVTGMQEYADFLVDYQGGQITLIAGYLHEDGHTFLNGRDWVVQIYRGEDAAERTRWTPVQPVPANFYGVATA